MRPCSSKSSLRRAPAASGERRPACDRAGSVVVALVFLLALIIDFLALVIGVFALVIGVLAFVIGLLVLDKGELVLRVGGGPRAVWEDGGRGIVVVECPH